MTRLGRDADGCACRRQRPGVRGRQSRGLLRPVQVNPHSLIRRALRGYSGTLVVKLRALSPGDTKPRVC